MTMIEWLQERGATSLFIAWMRESGAEGPAEAVTDCPRGDWLLWVAQLLGYDPDDLAAASRPARLRAAREHAAAAMDAAGLSGHATALRALPDDVSMPVASRAAVDAEFGANELRYRSDAAAAATRSASCACAAWSTSSEAAGWAAGAAEWAAWPQGEAASRAAFEAEHARCAAEVRDALPGLAARWSGAIDAWRKRK